MRKRFQPADSRRGFTIVELLVVIVVIAILAIITIVVFSGMQERAIKSSLSQALSSTAKRLELDKVTRGNYAPSLSDIQSSTTTLGDGVTYQYTGSDTAYCVTATLRSIAMSISSTQTNPTDGVCDGHNEPVAGPVTDPIVYTQTGSFNVTQPASGGVDVPITINYTLQPTDYVFILFNARNNTIVTMRNGATPMPSLYAQNMGNSGYQRHFAFGIGGLTGQPTLTANSCWATSCTYEGASTNGAYVVYVMRGLGANPTVASTYTPYGAQPGFNVAVAPAAQTIDAGDAAIFSYVYYANLAAAEADISSPSLTWTTDSTAPNNHLGTAIATRHTYATTNTSVQYQMTMPASGTHRHGSVLFTFK